MELPGRQMFEDAFGPRFGPRVYTSVFSIVLLALVGGIALGAFHGYHDVHGILWPEASAERSTKYPLNDDSRDRLVRALEHTPTAARFHVTVYWPQISGGERHAKDVAQAFRDANWQADISGAELTFGHGVSFMIPGNVYSDPDKWPQEAKRLMHFLDDAKVEYVVSPNGGLIVPYAFVVGPAE
jgi:hypothetical protein